MTGEVVKGEFLQPTVSLMRRFNVSRPTMREALRLLENEQLISVRQGSRRGVQVLQVSTDAATRMAGQTLQATGATIADLYEAQIGFEPFAARLLAKRSDRRDIAELRGHYAVLKQTLAAGSVSEHGVALARFHHLLVSLTGNKVMILVGDLIASTLERHQQRDDAKRYGAIMTEKEKLSFRLGGIKSIAKLIQFIEDGQVDEAEAHWRRHVENANEYWLRDQDRHALVNVVF
ncbi:FadR/GntR family transcriptional regulator [Sphingomonas paeninsulae]|uniref:FadR/GntR family transcriptional regulator n=1 Tax=Sphingomonas paeninsulae TaxID=2319844 RepID=UPI0013CEEEFD|nr:FCD domain-containing protein [Sphingomonas paeninsulae]